MGKIKVLSLNILSAILEAGNTKSLKSNCRCQGLSPESLHLQVWAPGRLQLEQRNKTNLDHSTITVHGKKRIRYDRISVTILSTASGVGLSADR